jgi:hypothetical protein
LEEGVIFDDVLREEADKESRFKTSDLKYYLLTFAFIGLGAIIFYKYSKK